MKIPMSWLNDYMDASDISPFDYNRKMTMSGSKVEAVENTGAEIINVVTAKILKTEKHPDADKLLVCTLDKGDGEVQIVTGAPNVKAGQIVPAALDGATLPGGKHIKTGKLRGVPSYGMMCSAGELGFSESEYEGANDGIMILPEDTPVGKDIRDVLGLNENVVEFEITSNRPDCFSVIGLARESAVTFGREFKLKAPVIKKETGDVNSYVKINVLDTEKCPRYCAKAIKNVKIGPSPKWMADRLKACGIRSINNIVDITNYVNLEYGQPMHAFDMNFLENGEINVRRAEKGEKITTLDGTKRKLDETMLVIADGKKAVAVAGVMGGENSEVTEDTHAILFESANFDGASVRITAKKLGLRTEASARYEKGLDPQNAEAALLRACELVEELGCGEVVGGMIDIDNSKKEVVKIPFEPEKINAFLGLNISEEFMVNALSALEFKIENGIIIVPSFRPDVLRTADVAEEVLRIYGYDKLASTPLRGEVTNAIRTFRQKMTAKARNLLCACGFFECVTYSFTNPNIFDKLNVSKNDKMRKTVVITNPLGVENSIMRTTLLASIMEVLVRNINLKNTNAKFFELGKTYIPQNGEPLPKEKNMLSLGMYGNYDFYDLKGAVEALLDDMGVLKYRFTPVSDNPTFHPGRCAEILIKNESVGIIGQIHPAVCDNYGVNCEIYCAEIDFDAIVNCAKPTKQYKPLPKYPAVVRDLAILADDETLAADIESVIKKKAGNLFSSLVLFDVYKGKQVPDGKKSMAYKVTLQAEDRTLTDEDISKTVKNILEALKKDLNAELRL